MGGRFRPGVRLVRLLRKFLLRILILRRSVSLITVADVCQAALLYSPYDGDNHVVSEIYDPELGKWVMLDPTTGCYFIDRMHQPDAPLKGRALPGDPIDAVFLNERLMSTPERFLP